MSSSQWQETASRCRSQAAKPTPLSRVQRQRIQHGSQKPRLGGQYGLAGTQGLGGFHCQMGSVPRPRPISTGSCNNGQIGYACGEAGLIAGVSMGMVSQVMESLQLSSGNSFKPMIMCSGGAVGQEPSGTRCAPTAANSSSLKIRSGLRSIFTT